jgi:hypothetical protein
MGSEAAVRLQLVSMERADLLVFCPFLELCTLLCFVHVLSGLVSKTGFILNQLTVPCFNDHLGQGRGQERQKVEFQSTEMALRLF